MATATKAKKDNGMNNFDEVPAWMRKLSVGHKYFVQSCTKDWVGEVISVDGPYTVTLKNASWVAESGRLHVFVRDGKAENMEVEPVGVVCVQWVDWIPWDHDLFTESV